MFTVALLTIAKKWKQPKCPPTGEWIKKKTKLWYINTMESFSAIKMNEILPFGTTWMDLDCIMLSEISETEKDKYYMISGTCIIQKQSKQETNQP